MDPQRGLPPAPKILQEPALRNLGPFYPPTRTFRHRTARPTTVRLHLPGGEKYLVTPDQSLCGSWSELGQNSLDFPHKNAKDSCNARAPVYHPPQ